MAREDRGFAWVARVNHRATAGHACTEFDGVNASSFDGVNALESLLNDLHGGQVPVFGNGTYNGREPGEAEPHHSLRVSAAANRSIRQSMTIIRGRRRVRR
jgi:hypothetical protein